MLRSTSPRPEAMDKVDIWTVLLFSKKEARNSSVTFAIGTQLSGDAFATVLSVLRFLLQLMRMTVGLHFADPFAH